jgi:thiol-disulfide isomerase/thioredoxin
MKKLVYTLFMILLIQVSEAQVNWIRDFKTAQALALSNNQFIVVDFWAVWCGPCKRMDDELWNSNEMLSLKDKFIYLKVDIDSDLSMRQTYQANVIPKVIIIDPKGEIIWAETGFANSFPYLKNFSSFPDVRYNTEDFAKFIADNDRSAALPIGLWYQSIIDSMDENPFKNDFMNLSDLYLKIASKSDDQNIASVAESNLVLNLAIRGKAKKAIKQAEGLEDGDFKNYILAYCYQCEGDLKVATEYAQKIQSEELKEKLSGGQ